MYNVRVDHMAEDVPSVIQSEILAFICAYDFPYVTAISDKHWLRTTFTEFFKNRHSYEWLKGQVYAKAQSEGKSLRGVAAVALCEPNRIHTGALGAYLLRKGQTQCQTIHTYGSESMQPSCWANLEGHVLDIKAVLANSFPATYDELKRTDAPMIPQHPNCRHVMAPLDGIDI